MESGIAIKIDLMREMTVLIEMRSIITSEMDSMLNSIPLEI